MIGSADASPSLIIVGSGDEALCSCVGIMDGLLANMAQIHVLNFLDKCGRILFSAPLKYLLSSVLTLINNRKCDTSTVYAQDYKFMPKHVDIFSMSMLSMCS